MLSLNKRMKKEDTKDIHSNSSNKMKDLKKNLPLLLMFLPGGLVLLIFNYLPLTGLVLAFKDFVPSLGLSSPFIGLKNFEFYFTSFDAIRTTFNTLSYNLIFIVSSVICALIVTVMMNEIKKMFFLKFSQTMLFIPYFISWVVVSYVVFAYLDETSGIVNSIFKSFGTEGLKWYSEPKLWWFILPIVYLWKNVGYFTLIFYAGILGMDKEIFQAAEIDGATKIQMIRKITIPLLKPLILMVVLLQLGRIFYADFGIFYNLPRDLGILYPSTDVIDTYVYRALRRTGDIGMASAVGFYQSIVGFILVVVANKIVKSIHSESAIF